MPSLINKKLLEKVCINISDSDAQFFMQIDNAIRPYFKNVKRIQCKLFGFKNLKCGDFHSNNMDIIGFVQICSQPNKDSEINKYSSICFPPVISNEESIRKKSAYSRCIPLFL